jgi:hypothetical protein
MVVGFTTTYATSAYHHWRSEFECRSDEVYSIQHYVKINHDKLKLRIYEYRCAQNVLVSFFIKLIKITYLTCSPLKKCDFNQFNGIHIYVALIYHGLSAFYEYIVFNNNKKQIEVSCKDISRTIIQLNVLVSFFIKLIKITYLTCSPLKKCRGMGALKKPYYGSHTKTMWGKYFRIFHILNLSHLTVITTLSSTYANILKYHIQGMPTNILLHVFI